MQETIVMQPNGHRDILKASAGLIAPIALTAVTSARCGAAQIVTCLQEKPAISPASSSVLRDRLTKDPLDELGRLSVRRRGRLMARGDKPG